MISAGPLASAAMMNGLLAFLDSFSTPSTIDLYETPRPASGAAPAGVLVATLSLVRPCGSVNQTTGTLSLFAGYDGPVSNNQKIVFGRVKTGNGLFVFDCDVRTTTDPDGGQELVIQVPATAAGGLLKLISGTFNVA